MTIKVAREGHVSCKRARQIARKVASGQGTPHGWRCHHYRPQRRLTGECRRRYGRPYASVDFLPDKGSARPGYPR